MNPETLLHMAAEQLTIEAVKGPGTMFLVKGPTGLDVTRSPNPAIALLLIAKFDCDEFRKGLSSNQWARLLKDIWNAHTTGQKGDASEQQPAKKP